MSLQRQGFPRVNRLSGKLAFAAVYAAKAKVGRWPLVVYSRPNQLRTLRLGLSVSRTVGIAVQRNRIKRLLREAFRLRTEHRDLGLDLIVVVRPHTTKPLKTYQQLLGDAIAASEAIWRGRPEAE